MNSADFSNVLDELILCVTEVVSSAEAVKNRGEKVIAALKAAQTMSGDTNTAEPSETEEQQIPEQKPAYSFSDVRRAFSIKSHDGYTAQIRELIAGYGVSKLSDVKPEDYEAIMADLEKLV